MPIERSKTSPLAHTLGVVRRLVLVSGRGSSPPSWAVALAEEFPTVPVSIATVAPSGQAVVIRAEEWLAPHVDFGAIDTRVQVLVEAGRTFDLCVVSPGDVAARIGMEVLTRYQRHLGRRTPDSQSPLFDDVLKKHRSLHDLGKPLVRADYDHALDAWQWILRLSPAPGLALELAVLMHDVERLASEADARVEQHARDYQAFKDAHARGGAVIARRTLAEAGVDEATCARVAHLVEAHERPSADPEIRLLNDADGLSFFSLNSAGYADYFGLDQTRAKVKWTLARMGRAARARLTTMRMRADIARLVGEARGTGEVAA